MILEREAALERLGEALSTVRSGGGRVALIAGEAGIGKTALVERFLQQHPDARIYRGGCEALTTPRPLAPLYDIAPTLPGDTLRLLEGKTSRNALFPAVLRGLQACGPTVVVFEDLHWADEATLDLAIFLGRRTHLAPCLLVLTYRDDELAALPQLQATLGSLPSAAALHLELQPLSTAAVGVLARQAGRPAGCIHALTGGNPFFVHEILTSGSDAVPGSVQMAVVARHSRLDPEARAVAELVSVVPGMAERWLLDATMQPHPDALDRCVAHGLLQWQRGGLSFRHELARRAVEEGLPPGRRRSLHEQVLVSLLDQGRKPIDLARVVHHAMAADDEATVLHFAPDAARQAAALGAHREAARHYAAALSFAAAIPEAAQAELFEAQAYECYLTSDIAAAEAAQRAALALWRRLRAPRGEGRALRWLSRLAWFGGQKDQAHRRALEAIAVLEQVAPSAELAMAYSNRSQIHMLADETAEATTWARRALDLAEMTGDAVTRVHALNNLGSAQLIAADPRGSAALEASLELALAGQFEEHAARAYTNLASAAVRERDYARASAYLRSGIGYCVERDLDSWSLYMRAWQARAQLEQGAWAEAEAEAEQLLQLPNVPPVTRIAALVVVGLLRARRGAAGAAALLDEARDLAVGTQELQRIAPVTAARAEAAWLAGDTRRCREELREALALATALRRPLERGALSLWLVRTGEPGVSSEGCAGPYALEVAGDWAAAAAAWAGLGCPYEQALALADGDDAALGDGLAILERLGARRAAAVVERRLHERQAQRRSRGPYQRTRANPAGLTDRQVDVLRLVACGRQNAAIAQTLCISPKTVDHHVAAIFDKLDVRSRAQATAAAARLGLLASA